MVNRKVENEQGQEMETREAKMGNGRRVLASCKRQMGAKRMLKERLA